MRVLVCGSRYFTDYELLKEKLDELRSRLSIPVSTIIHGDARGADRFAGRYADDNKIHLQVYPADWNTYGKRAGPIRNAQMLREGNPDYVVAFRGPNSRGTQNMIDQATKAGIPVEIIDVS